MIVVIHGGKLNIFKFPFVSLCSHLGCRTRRVDWLIDSLLQEDEKRELLVPEQTDLFSLYFLFSFRPRDVTPENCFFQVPPYSLTHVRMICEKTKRKFPRASRGLNLENKAHKLKKVLRRVFLIKSLNKISIEKKSTANSISGERP